MRQLVLVTLLASIVACATPGKDTAIGAGAGAGEVRSSAASLADGKERRSVRSPAASSAVPSAITSTSSSRSSNKFSDARRTESGLLLNLRSSLVFTKDSAVVQPAAVEELARLGDILAKYPQDRIRIEGFTDPAVLPRATRRLSLRRAEAVRDILASRGVGRGRCS